ncbi:hypothetical protein L218DRAFT_983085 [Marasmius fiardii PR-910]|nr:hypothetical protein L218DRAFT_983085 [Marasmius fiardii PR-910]
MHYAQTEGFTSTVLQYSIYAWHWSPVKKSVFSNSLIFPAYLTVTSACLLFVHICLVFIHRRSQIAETEPSESPVRQAGVVSDIKEYVRVQGGFKIYAFRTARLLCSLILLALAVKTLVAHELSMDAVKIAKKHTHQFTKRGWLEAAMCLTFLYTSFLGLISISATPQWCKVVIRHMNTVLFATFVVYFYRDIYPMATVSKKSQDLFEGWVLWLKIGLLGISSILVPLFIPRQYEPVDILNPSTPSPEQTACLFSMLVYTYLDPLVFYAYQVPHLSWDKLPPLSDYDFARVLKEKSFKHLDIFSGAPRTRHLAIGLLRVFRVEYTIMCLSIIVHVFTNFLGPIAMNRILRYMELGGQQDALVQPWVWILFLFVDPMLGSLSIQWYIFIATRTLVRVQAIITQLVFEHSLRIRVKAEPPDSPTETPKMYMSPSDSRPISPSNDENESEGSATWDHSGQTTAQESSFTLQAGDDAERSKSKTSPSSDSSNLVGKINNLITTDLDNLVETRDFLFVLVYVPVQIAFGMVFLYIVLGWSALVGLAMMILTLPVPWIVARLVQKVQDQRMKRTDGRVQSVTETMNVLRMIKLFGWEKKIEARITAKRDDELIWIKRRLYLDLLNGSFNKYNILSLRDQRIKILTEFNSTLVMKKELNASTVFSSMTVLEMLRTQLHVVFDIMTATIAGKVSLDRISKFLKHTELLDTYENKNAGFSIPEDRSHDIGFRNSLFTWSRNVDGTLTPSKRRFVLKIDDELIFKKGCINLIFGETGSGKTSLLMALLSEMCFIPCGTDSWYNLPRDHGIAYAAQESWVQNETIRDNIVFGSEHDEERYKKVIYQCGLERDLSLFEAGDATEVGEKGLTLSGGQKARITLARAIYSKAAIILLDDVLAALDVHTSKWIVEKCLKGDLVKGRTIILVTHNVALTRPIAGFVVSLKDGCIVSQGTMADALEHSIALQEEESKDKETSDKSEEEVDPKPFEPSKLATNKKLIVAEEIEEGHVSWSALKVYFAGMGTWKFFASVIGAFLLVMLTDTCQTWFLGYWASQYENHDPSEVSVFWHLSMYSGLLFTNVVLYCTGFFIFVLGAIRAARTVHNQLIHSLLGTTLRWLDTTPVSRVITRCTQDIRVVDGPIATSLRSVGELTILLIVKFFVVVFVVPFFIPLGVFVIVVGLICGQIYMKAQLSVKREMSNARAPVLGHVGAAIAGLTSIRAYGVEERFIHESLKRIDKYSRAARTFFNLNRWICIRMDLLGGSFTTGLAAYLVYSRGLSAANTGFSLNMAVGFSMHILWWVRQLNDFEVQGKSLERIQGYIKIEQEPQATLDGEPPAYWPASGELRVESLSAKYSLDGPRVLHDLSFVIRSGERVGVVGRTGSGKSSLTLSLLRCIFTEGKVYYDGIPTDSINLESLRTSITIIPQMPELLSGTLRQNLDPFDQYDDATLHNALRAAGLYSLQSTEDEGRLTLDSAISNGGDNLSVGQRQILALARALVRGSKLLILDEATSAIDYETDSIIQNSLRKELPADVTLITVAHRLQTIMDADKILVLDAGRIVEFDTPEALLKQEDGTLRALVDESNDRATLYEMAGKGRVKMSDTQSVNISTG